MGGGGRKRVGLADEDGIGEGFEDEEDDVEGCEDWSATRMIWSSEGGR